MALGTVGTILFFLSVVAVTQLSLRRVTRIVTDEPREPLRDLLHSVLPEWLSEYHEYVDWFPMLVIGLLAILDRFVHAVEFIWLLGILFLLRVISYNLTILPSPEKACKNQWDHEPETYLRRVLNIMWQEGCGDLMFSGHTVCMVLGSLFICKYCCVGNYLAYGTLIAYNILGMVLIVGTRMHYSVDVFMAAVVTILVFVSKNNFFLSTQ